MNENNITPLPAQAPRPFLFQQDLSPGSVTQQALVASGHAAGDLYYGLDGVRFTRLGIGNANALLYISNSVPKWTTDLTYANSILTLSGTNTGILLNNVTAEPSAPAANNIEFYASKISGRSLPKWISPAGHSFINQPAFISANLILWSPTAATAGLWYGAGGGTPGGTFTQLEPTTTNLYTVSRRGKWTNVVTTTNQSVGPRTSTAIFFSSTTAGMGGFFFYCRFGVEAITTNCRWFVGLTATAAILANDPSAAVNIVGFGFDAGDSSVLSFMHNNGSGTAVKTSITGLPSFAANQGYEAYIYMKPGDNTTIYYRLDNINLGTTIVDSSIASEVPVDGTKMFAVAECGNAANTVANVVGIGVNEIYIETDR